jgi:hypothetical protein
MSIESICLSLRGLFVRCISNLPSASDKKLCFTLWQLQLCRTSNDKPVYSKFQIVSLVDFHITISVALSHVINIWSVLYTLLTLRSSSFITAWTPDDFICLGGGCGCGSFCYNDACSSTPRHIRLSTGLFTGSSCSATLHLSTRPSIEDRVLPSLTPLHRGVCYQSSNILGYTVCSLVINWAVKVSPLVIIVQVRDTTDCLGPLAETLHW